MSKKTTLKRNKIKKRIRKVVFGSKDKPRLSVFRSNKEIYAQIIDDVNSSTIVAASSVDKDLKLKTTNKIEISKIVGDSIAKKAIKAGVKKVSFDRNGYLYHGRVKSLADGAREAGLNF
jgi:large subunit ribosomal protein L18|tara:strand:+ start:124 stop:480 length:357 start_codon:yes stop_codon:yes gene_type:complete